MSGISVLKCHQCAKQLSRTAKFCPACGTRLSAVENELPSPENPVPNVDANVTAGSSAVEIGDPNENDTMRADSSEARHATTESESAHLGTLGQNLRRIPSSLWVVSGVAVVLLIVAAIILGRGRPVDASATAQTRSPVTLYVLRSDAPVRSAPSSTNSVAVTTLSRGESVSGDWVVGLDGKSTWLKLRSGAYSGDYVWNKSLAGVPPPEIAKFLGTSQVLAQSAQIYAAPDVSAAVLQYVQRGLTVYAVGVTPGGWTEITLKRGGVGYLPSSAFAATEPTMPAAVDGPGSFEAHRAIVYDGRLAGPDFQHSPSRYKRFRTVISQGASRGVNFGGHYAVVMFGCGAGCQSVVIVDVQSGQIFDFPLGGESNYLLTLDYRSDSTLIAAHWQENGGENTSCVAQNFVLVNTSFSALQQQRESGRCPN